MRILMHHRTQGHGVESVHLLGMANAFRRAGAEVEIVSPPGVVLGKGGEPPVRRGGLGGLWHVLAARMPEAVFELMEIAYNVPALGRLRTALKQAPTDFLYERYAYFNVSGALAARLRRVPLVLEVNYTTRTKLYRKRSRLLMPLARALERFVFRRAAVINAVTGELRRQVIAAGADPSRVVVTPNAADPERFRPEISGAAVRARFGLGDAPVIGFTGQVVPWHGVDLLIDGLPEILRRIPDARLFLVGDGPARPGLEAQARERGVSDRVIFAGWVVHQSLPEHIAVFDVAVQPNSNDYASPVKIYEYMAMGKPVVAPRLGPLEEGIADGAGILFPPRNVPAMADAIAGLLADDGRRRAMGARAREHILAHHTWDRNAARVFGALSSVSAVREPAPAVAS